MKMFIYYYYEPCSNVKLYKFVLSGHNVEFLLIGLLEECTICFILIMLSLVQSKARPQYVGQCRKHSHHRGKYNDSMARLQFDWLGISSFTT